MAIDLIDFKRKIFLINKLIILLQIETLQIILSEKIKLELKSELPIWKGYFLHIHQLECQK